MCAQLKDLGAAPIGGGGRSASAGPLLIGHEFPLRDGGGVIVLHVGRVLDRLPEEMTRKWDKMRVTRRGKCCITAVQRSAR